MEQCDRPQIMCLRRFRVSCRVAKKFWLTHPDVQPLLICSRSGDDIGFLREMDTEDGPLNLHRQAARTV